MGTDLELFTGKEDMTWSPYEPGRQPSLSVDSEMSKRGNEGRARAVGAEAKVTLGFGIGTALGCSYNGFRQRKPQNEAKVFEWKAKFSLSTLTNWLSYMTQCSKKNFFLFSSLA